MDRKALKEQLKELFPHLKESEADLLVSTGDDINILITRVLDNNIEAPSLQLKELVRTNYAPTRITHTYNFPEAFISQSSINMHQDVRGLRAQASSLNLEANEFTKQAIGHPVKEARYHFSIEAEAKRTLAKKINREAALILMRKIVEGTGPVDLHGFSVEEALLFMDDLLYFRKFTEIQVITGQRYNSAKIRPALQEWFVKNKFMYSDAGPGLIAKKKAIHFLETDMRYRK